MSLVQGELSRGLHRTGGTRASLYKVKGSITVCTTE